MKINIDWEVNKKQQIFINCNADEVLYGGAAGGGKSYGQLIDAFLFAMQYPKSKQLILRRTLPELEKSLIRTSLEIYPKGICRHNSSKHVTTFVNGSIIDFGYCDAENDVYKYQSSEYDIIRFDELTHFTKDMYIYLISRVRGANDFPKQVKSSTNPGGIGHNWVKERFIDIGPPYKTYNDEKGNSRCFIPAKVEENVHLMAADPGYKKRLLNLEEKHQQALLYGNWDIYDGQFFTEFKRDIHVVEPFTIPPHWRKYFAMDYGLDMLAAYVIAVDEHNRAYVMREYCESKLIISAAAKKVCELCADDDIDEYYAPGDLWAKRQETGRSVAEIFYDNGIMLTKTDNNRVSGWANLHEWLKPFEDETGTMTANLVIFNTCTELIRCLPALIHDKKNVNDVSKEPHDITHSPDAIRYFVMGRPLPAETKPEQKIVNFSTDIPEQPYAREAVVVI